MPRGRSARLFLVLTLIFAIIDAVFVAVNIRFAGDAFRDSLTQEGASARAVFQSALSQTTRDMLSLATFIAGDPEVQALFRQGRDAVRAEGGGAGGSRAAQARAALMAKVSPSWRLVQERFDARQLHFHLGPGSLSFLRVHAPGKFGDRLDDVRPLIVAADREQTPQSGFETGRIYAGVRGAVPITLQDMDDTPDPLGVLEVGTSMQPLLDTLARNHDWSLAALLRAPHVRDAMWSEYRNALFPAGGGACDCVVEAATAPEAVPLLKLLEEDGADPFTAGTRVVSRQDRSYAVTHFPLVDFLGTRHPERGPVGTILIWRDATEATRALARSNTFNVLYAIAAFISLEILLLIAFRAVGRHLRAEIDDKTAALARSNRDLEEFVYIASHDLREPLRMVAGYLGLLERRYANNLDNRGHEFLTYAINGARRMEAMIHDLLDLSRVSTQARPAVPVRLSEVVEDAMDSLRAAIADSGAEISIEAPLPDILGDPAQLTRLVQNLLANGIKYQPTGQRPILRVWSDRDEAGHCRLHVADNGIGIPDDQRERIFQMFQRLHTPGEYDGSGIGLAVCRRIAEHHGGTLTVEDNPVGGSVFTLTLPCAEA